LEINFKSDLEYFSLKASFEPGSLLVKDVKQKSQLNFELKREKKKKKRKVKRDMDVRCERERDEV
jgi:hypothetical protein